LHKSAIANIFTSGIAVKLSEITQKTALEWQRLRFNRNKTLQNVLEGFFNLRRNWSS
jgi:hypothetical protein